MASAENIQYPPNFIRALVVNLQIGSAVQALMQPYPACFTISRIRPFAKES